MHKVNNKKAINKLAAKSFTAAKPRNLIAATAIALTTILFTSLFTVAIGMMESIQQQTVRQAGGDGHIALKYITEEQYQGVKGHNLIERISYNKIIGDASNPEFLKRRVEIYYMDETAMELGFCTPTTGTAPQSSDEVALDVQSLQLLGVAAEVGAKVPLEYTMKDKQYHTDFVLSGFWTPDPAMPVGFALFSEAFTTENAAALQNTYREDSRYSGAINAYIMCKNSFNLENKMDRIITESGYTIEDEDRATQPLETDITANTNWAYVSGGKMDAGTAVGGVAALLLFALAGYLIIHNVFQISVQRDIRFYGLLKTIGTTGKQLKCILRRQAFVLSLVATPIGLFGGFLIGKFILPIIMSISDFTSAATVSINPTIFLLAALFSLCTVFISTSKPAKIAAAVSPVEAAKYSGSSEIKSAVKRSMDGGKVWRMAFSNLARNKKRSAVTIISLSLSLVLLNTVFTITQGFDMDKYLARQVDSDFLAGHANYFNMQHVRFPEDACSDTLISQIELQEEFEDGGRLYYNIYAGNCSIVWPETGPLEAQGYAGMNLAKDGFPMLDLYGLSDFPMSRIKLVEGSADPALLQTGKYILEGLPTDDNGKVYEEFSHYDVGDVITIVVDGVKRDFELLGKFAMNANANTNRWRTDFTMYLPEKVYLDVVTQPIVMSYAFNVKDGAEAEMETFLSEYTEKIEPQMGFESKSKYEQDFKGLQNMFITVGGMLCVIIGMIGLLNFVNSILAGIITRRREFATLQSIGMTKRQLIQLLVFEGGYYSLLTAVASVLISVLFSIGVVGTLVSKLWFFSYHFTLLPLAIVCPILLVLGMAIPWITYQLTGRESIVERLREVE